MFAIYLSTEEREKLFELIYKLACCDEECAEEEKELVNTYKNELLITEIPDTDTIGGLTEYFVRKENRIKRMVLFEVCTLILADNHVGEIEQEAYDGIKRAFALGDIVTEDIVSAANDYQVIRDRILDTIFV